MKRLWYILPILVVCAIVLYSLQPYLSMNAPIGKGALVVEGWMPAPYFTDVANVYRNGNYDKLVTTGTIRPCSYYLKDNECIVLSSPISEGNHEFTIEASGVSGAKLAIVEKGDTLFQTSLSSDNQMYRFLGSKPLGDSLEILAYSTVSNDWNTQIVFIKNLELRPLKNGIPDDWAIEAHTFYGKVHHIDRYGMVTDGTPYYSDQAKKHLLANGIEPTDIMVVRASECGIIGHTLCNAQAFGELFRNDAFEAAELVTLGVHARRSFLNYRSQSTGIEWGVVSIPDSTCTSSNWMKSRLGRYKVLKEMGGLFFGAAIDPQELENE